MKKKTAKSIIGTREQQNNLPDQSSKTNIDKIARAIVKQNPFTSSIEQHNAEAKIVIQLLTDYPDLLADIQSQIQSEINEDISSVKDISFTQEQIVNLARFHFKMKAGNASSEYLQKEIDRYLNNTGIF